MWYETGLGTNGNGNGNGMTGMNVGYVGMILGAGITAAIGVGIAHLIDRDKKWGAGIGAGLSLATSMYMNYSGHGSVLPAAAPANGLVMNGNGLAPPVNGNGLPANGNGMSACGACGCC